MVKGGLSCGVHSRLAYPDVPDAHPAGFRYYPQTTFVGIAEVFRVAIEKYQIVLAQLRRQGEVGRQPRQNWIDQSN